MHGSSDPHRTAWSRPRDDTFQAFGDDTYRNRRRPPDPSRCPECDAVYHDGHWRWVERPSVYITHTLCPACERIRDRFPGGMVLVSGTFVSQHRDEIVGLILNQSDAETAEHPLNRIMLLDERQDSILIATTDDHLPRRLGTALERAYGGELQIDQLPGERRVDVRWRRDLPADR